MKVNKTDANDALGLAEIMRVGWYRKVEVKGHDCQALRALLVARAQLVSQVTTLKNCVRGILKVFGRVLPKKLRAQFIAQAREACFLNASAIAGGVEATVPRHTILSASSITATDVSFSDTSRPTYWIRLDMGSCS